jgi:flavin reductase ActVB
MTTVDQMAFRNAMAQFASGVTIVATTQEDGQPKGFTASAFSSLSLDPPLILVCLDHKAESHPAFERAEHFTVSILAEGQAEAALRFARSGSDKFGGFEVEPGSVTAMPVIPDALVHLECRMHDRLPGGDHTILIGEVLSAHTYEERRPLIHHNRRFGVFQPRD